jgi:hypothetical protein
MMRTVDFDTVNHEFSKFWKELSEQGLAMSGDDYCVIAEHSIGLSIHQARLLYLKATTHMKSRMLGMCHTVEDYEVISLPYRKDCEGPNDATKDERPATEPDLIYFHGWKTEDDAGDEENHGYLFSIDHVGVLNSLGPAEEAPRW